MKFVQVNGICIHYKWIDNKKGKTFLFINSLGTDFRIWDEVVEVLKEHGNILLFDKRGHGLSDFAADTDGLNDFATEVLALIENFPIKKCILIGLSVGGMIAQLIASKKPEIIDKLILCDTRYKIGNAQIWNDRIAVVKEKGLAAIADSVMQRWFSEKFIKEEAVKVSGYKNMLERTLPLGYVKTCEAIRDADLTAIAKQIKIPTLCIVGYEDKSTTPEDRILTDHQGRAQGFFHQLVQRHNTADQPCALGLGRIHHAARERHVHSFGLAHRARQPLRAARAGDDAQLDLGLAEFCVVGCNDEIAHHRQLAAAAEREAAHGCDHRFANAANRFPILGDVVALVNIGKAVSGHRANVSTGGKGFLAAGDDHAADFFIGIKGFERCAELVHELAV